MRGNKRKRGNFKKTTNCYESRSDNEEGSNIVQENVHSILKLPEDETNKPERQLCNIKLSSGKEKTTMEIKENGDLADSNTCSISVDSNSQSVFSGKESFKKPKARRAVRSKSSTSSNCSNTNENQVKVCTDISSKSETPKYGCISTGFDKISYDIKIDPNVVDRYTNIPMSPPQPETAEQTEERRKAIDIIARQCRLHPSNRKLNQGPVVNPPLISPGIMVGYTPAGQRHEVDLNFGRPKWFNSEYARRQFDDATTINVRRMFADLKSGNFLPDNLDPNIERRYFAERVLVTKDAREHFEKKLKNFPSKLPEDVRMSIFEEEQGCPIVKVAIKFQTGEERTITFTRKEFEKLIPTDLMKMVNINTEELGFNEEISCQEKDDEDIMTLEVEAKLLDLAKFAAVQLKDFPRDVAHRLTEALNLKVTPLMFKKHPYVVETIEKLSTQCYFVDVVYPAIALLQKIKSLFDVPKSQTFEEFFSAEVRKLEIAVQDMNHFDIFMMTKDPTVMKNPVKTELANKKEETATDVGSQTTFTVEQETETEVTQETTEASNQRVSAPNTTHEEDEWIPIEDVEVERDEDNWTLNVSSDFELSNGEDDQDEENLEDTQYASISDGRFHNSEE